MVEYSNTFMDMVQIKENVRSSNQKKKSHMQWHVSCTFTGRSVWQHSFGLKFGERTTSAKVYRKWGFSLNFPLFIFLAFSFAIQIIYNFSNMLNSLFFYLCVGISYKQSQIQFHCYKSYIIPTQNQKYGIRNQGERERDRAAHSRQFLHHHHHS